MPTPRIPPANIRLKRAYAPVEAGDGARILVDRLWPRGVGRQRAALDDWMKDIAPSAALRRWFGHEPSRWEEFRRRYKAELRGHAADLQRLRAIAAKGALTLVYAARDEERNDAVVLREVLLRGE
jgi:uncharacterized protein YeaO (DUF488 family)